MTPTAVLDAVSGISPDMSLWVDFKRRPSDESILPYLETLDSEHLLLCLRGIDLTTVSTDDIDAILAGQIGGAIESVRILLDDPSRPAGARPRRQRRWMRAVEGRLAARHPFGRLKRPAWLAPQHRILSDTIEV